MQRRVRWAKIEYQPNLQTPIDPVPLGVILEEITSWGTRHVVLFGREPRGNIPGLQLEKAWGPFRDVVTEWFETISKSMREFVSDLDADEYAIDELAKRWKWNVYLRAPETRAVQSASLTLDHYGRTWYEEYIGEPFPRSPSPQNKPSTAARRRMQPWLARTNALEAAYA
jgi:hypothetical protein